MLHFQIPLTRGACEPLGASWSSPNCNNKFMRLIGGACVALRSPTVAVEG